MVGGHCKTLEDYNRLQGSSLILCLMTIIGLSLLPAIFVHAKVLGNDITIYNKGLALDKLGNYTGAILYYDKSTSHRPKSC